MKVYFAADHAGYELKTELIAFVRNVLGHEVEDCGAFELDPSDDYPELIAAAARKVSADTREGNDNRAIILGASGQGEAVVANRFPEVRAVVYYGPPPHEQVDISGKTLNMIDSTRVHNNANVLSLGSRFISHSEAKDVVRAWLAKEFSGEERHLRRIKQIDNQVCATDL